MIITKVFEFKIFVLSLGVLFLAVLTMTRAEDKRRPQYLFVLFMIYLVFQGFQYMEFYPLTAFQRFAKPEDRAVKYTQLVTNFEDGSSRKLPPENILPALKHGRAKFFLKSVVRKPAMADEFATSYNRAYERRVRKAGDPLILDLDFENKKWDLERDPFDLEQGFQVKKIKGEPRA
jgi:hypothetical protein